METTIINAYTQYRYYGAKDLFEYDAFKEVCLKLNDFFVEDTEIAMPLIGAGLAGGEDSLS